MKITVERTINAPVGEVWRAYSEPEDIKQWNAASDDWHTTASTVDLRPGGKFSSRMEAKDGSAGFDFTGTYVKVIDHELIEYTMGDRAARVEFVGTDGGTVVRVTFDAEDENPEEMQRAGWQSILDNFARHVEKSMKPVEQTWNADVYRRNARYVSDLATPVIDLLRPRAGERILDLGCGDGVLTKKLADLGCAMVGIDASPDLVAAAVRRGVTASVLDATQLSYYEEFDAVFSNAVLHWIKDADRVIAGVLAALTPGGRFVAECGGHRCVETIHKALIAELDRRGYDGTAASPWYFPTAAEYGARLERAGFEVRYIEVIERPTPLPQGMTGFIETFGGSFVGVLPPAERDAYVADVCSRVASTLRADDGTWSADYTRLRFEAHKPLQPLRSNR